MVNLLYVVTDHVKKDAWSCEKSSNGIKFMMFYYRAEMIMHLRVNNQVFLNASCIYSHAHLHF